MNNNCVSLRSRTGDQIADIPVDSFIENLKQKSNKKLLNRVSFLFTKKTKFVDCFVLHKKKQDVERYEWTGDC